MTKRESRYRRVFAKNLRRIRNLQGLSQEDLALKSGLHRTYIGSVERRERNISIDNMERLADSLSVSLIDLLKDCDEAT